MKMLGRLKLWLLLMAGAALSAASLGASIPAGSVLIPGGLFIPQYGSEGKPVAIAHFYFDRLPVTNADYHNFVLSHADWLPAAPPRLLADENYLRHWQQGSPALQALQQPVVNISWFAAAEYCARRGGRLPTTFEWEYAAAASEDRANASQDPQFLQRILDWYASPRGAPADSVGQGAPNFYGLHDMHGLVWQWTEDFNSLFTPGDNRRDGEKLAALFCGIGSSGSADPANYAAFMRYALRNSLQASYTASHLGFRCAYDSINEGQL